MVAGIGTLTPRRMKIWLVALFLGLTVPTVILLAQAWRQLEFETFYRYQTDAENLVERIDRQLGRQAEELANRPPEAFRYWADGDTGRANPSPLSTFPVPKTIPGLTGYFRVAPDGKFSTPYLPEGESGSGGASSEPDDVAARSELQTHMLGVLSANAILPERRTRSDAGSGVDEMQDDSAGAWVRESVPVSRESGPDRAEGERSSINAATQSDRDADSMNDLSSPSMNTPSDAGSDAVNDQRDAQAEGLVVFDQALDEPATDERLGRMQDLRLNDELQQKSQAYSNRQRSEEMVSEPAAIESEPAAPRRERSRAAPDPTSNRRVSAFQTTAEPLRYGRLSRQHSVLFRNARAGNERIVLGALLSTDEFIRGSILEAYRSSTLADMSDLVIGIGDDVVRIVNADERGAAGRYRSVAGELDGSLLLRTRLSPPFQDLSLVFSVSELPPGPAAGILLWTAAIFTLVLTAGLFALYRVGITQMRLVRQQQDFVAAVSHELKTPLTSIRMYGEMLRSGWVDESKRREYYAYIHDESERLARLIDNVLKLARLSRSEPAYDTKDVTVGELADLMASKLGEQIDRAGFELSVEIEPDARALILRLDTDCFLQIAINLADNALKFSRKSETKRIDCRFFRSEAGTLTFAVRDYGPGIPKSQLKKVFELFYRPESELTRQTVGTGIGLAIVSTLTRGMGGDVDVVNRKPGAEFSVRFPTRDRSDAANGHA